MNSDELVFHVEDLEFCTTCNVTTTKEFRSFLRKYLKKLKFQGGTILPLPTYDDFLMCRLCKKSIKINGKYIYKIFVIFLFKFKIIFYRLEW